MKKAFLFILFFSFSIGCMAQSTNFVVSSNKLVWENVFISSETNIPNLLARHTRLKITSGNGSIYNGNGVNLRNTCPGTSDFLKDDFSFNFEIEVREGKYRVTISDIVFCKKAKVKKNTTGAEKYLVDNDNLKTGDKADTDLTCLENYFTKLFSATTIYKNRS